MNLLGVILLGAFSGLIGAFAMNLFMRAVANKLGKRGDMVRALGSFFSRDKESAANIGTAIHCAAGVSFGIVYLTIIYLINFLSFPQAIFLGLGFGFFHGMVTSFILMFYASERHPDESFRKATIEEGALHLFGHMLYGIVVGLIGGLVAQGFAG